MWESERLLPQVFEERKAPVNNYYASLKKWLPIMKAYEVGARGLPGAGRGLAGAPSSPDGVDAKRGFSSSMKGQMLNWLLATLVLCCADREP